MCTERSRGQEDNLESCVPRNDSSFFSDHCEKEMEKATLTARDVLKQLFDNDSDFSGSDSDGKEGEEFYAYRSLNFSGSTSE